MAIQRLKQSKPEPEKAEDGAKIRAVAETTLSDIEALGDAVVRDLSQKFDASLSSFRLSGSEIKAAISKVSARDMEDIKFAQSQTRRFAKAQCSIITDTEVETMPRVILGHSNIPAQSVGCYVPGGKFPMMAAAHMSVFTANVADASRIIASAPPVKGEPHPAPAAAMHMECAREIYVLEVIQAVGAMAIGTETIEPIHMLVGPANAFVAEAKRQLFGRVGVDLFVGPTETTAITDERVDAELGATDFLGQAELGYNSPVAKIANSRKLAREPRAEVERTLEILPPLETAEVGGREYRDMIFCDSHDEMFHIANGIADEHVQIINVRVDWYLENMRSYVALFRGPCTKEANGNKEIGINQTLPTKKARHHTGRLWVGKSVKTH